MTEHSLLLLIPAYNEERRLEPVLRDYARYFKEHYQGKFQLVVVLNGCMDDTIGVVRRVGADYPAVSALEFSEAIGKGGALIEGLKLAPLADTIGYVDADGATPPHAFHELARRIDQADCVIGSSLRIADMAFDINLLYSLHRAGYRILEVPTEWTDKIGSKVTLFRTSLVMFLSVVRIWLIYSPRIYKWLRPLRPLEGWVYAKLRAPQPLPGPRDDGPKSKV